MGAMNIVPDKYEFFHRYGNYQGEPFEPTKTSDSTSE